MVSRLLFLVFIIYSNYSLSQLKVGFNADWPPYSYADKNGVAQGHLVEQMRVLLEKHKIDYQFIPLPWKRVQLMVSTGEIDAMVTAPTPERLEYSLTSGKVVYTVEVKAFINNQNPKINQLMGIKKISDFKAYQVCDLIGNGWAAEEYKKANVTVTFLPTTESCVKQVFYGYADLMMIAELAGLDLVQKNKFQNKITTLPHVFNQMNFVFLISKKSKYQNLVHQL